MIRISCICKWFITESSFYWTDWRLGVWYGINIGLYSVVSDAIIIFLLLLYDYYSRCETIFTFSSLDCFLSCGIYTFCWTKASETETKHGLAECSRKCTFDFYFICFDFPLINVALYSFLTILYLENESNLRYALNTFYLALILNCFVILLGRTQNIWFFETFWVFPQCC